MKGEFRTLEKTTVLFIRPLPIIKYQSTYTTTYLHLTPELVITITITITITVLDSDDDTEPARPMRTPTHPHVRYATQDEMRCDLFMRKEASCGAHGFMVLRHPGWCGYHGGTRVRGTPSGSRKHAVLNTEADGSVVTVTCARSDDSLRFIHIERENPTTITFYAHPLHFSVGDIHWPFARTKCILRQTTSLHLYCSRTVMPRE